MNRRDVLLASSLAFAAAMPLGGGCGGGSGGSGGGGAGTTGTGLTAEASGTTVSSSLALTKDDADLWIVNQDADSVSVIDTKTRAVVAEIPLGSAPPAVDPTTMRYEPAILPRALAIVNSKKVYVAGESANEVFVIDAEKHTVLSSIPVPAAPTGIAAAPDGSAVYVVSHEAARVTKIDPKTDEVVSGIDVTEHPWSVTVSADGASIFVTHLLLDPGVSVIDAASFTLKSKTKLADEAPGSSIQIPNGVARGLYAAVPRPTDGEIWVPHLLLATTTEQPALAFNTTVFPTVSTLSADGATAKRRLLFQPMVAGATGSFIDSVSGPHAIAFTPDGKLALLALAQSEDVMVFDADTGDETALVRPLSLSTATGLLEGIVVDHAGTHAYVDARSTHNVAVFTIDESSTLTPLAADGDPIDRIHVDPMPADLRTGQRLFYTANSSAYPITKDFWVACASCHLEGGSDAVTWRFKEGPRDTPSNAGGPINTGFLLHQALRSNVDQYDATIREEQGGTYDLTKPAQKVELDILAGYVNYAIPFPQNPNRSPDGTLTASQMRGQTTFTSHCASCHTGPYLTDSGAGNPTLDFTGTIVLHDVGTCVQSGTWPDKIGTDVDGVVHAPCQFDTPTLRGVFATPPYFHDGSAATLGDVVDRLAFSSGLSASDKADLVAYLLTL